VDDVPVKKGKIVSVKSDEPLLTAFTALLTNGVLSVPVYDDAAKVLGGGGLPSSSFFCFLLR